MRILLTGGAGDLASVLSKTLDARGDTAVRLDVRPPADSRGIFVQGSLLDLPTLESSMSGADCVVHIAAWHGIHEARGEKDVFDFWSLNVTGTFYVFETAARLGITRVVFISSTSVEERDTIYGQSKIVAETIAQGYVERLGLNVITLRPRAFIPHWNRQAYNNFVEWAHWFWGGAVHINDVAQGVLQSIDLLAARPLPEHLVLTLDGAYDFSDDDLAAWDADGAGSTFRRVYPQYVELALRHGLDPARRPEKR
ncbi:MAG: NAD(P)-dependent oxidoreductase, partial [Anaerolineae bacterium]|nr:NAD(P)-dependent oxidoreductase [Anaerolineae bacterium]